ncbi:MAG: glycosyltransferase family 2 protein [Opitutales bacterium]
MSILLSICIPTYNRAELLRDLLHGLEKECAAYPDAIEIIVRDNCSPDNTEEIVASYQKTLRLVYIQNKTNVGIAANIYDVPDMASGRFCWILGDDDLVVPGAIPSLLNTINSNPDYVAYIVGYSYEPDDRRDELVRSSEPLTFTKPIFGDRIESQHLDRWEETFLLTETPGLHTSIVSCIFDLSHWQRAKKELNLNLSVEPLTTLKSTFPHTYLWSYILSGKQCYFIPQPSIYFCLGAQEWFKPKWATIMFTFLLELAQHFRKDCADEGAVRHYEEIILREVNTLKVLLLTPNDFAKEHFSLSRLIRDYGSRDLLWQSLYTIVNEQTGKERFALYYKVTRAALFTPHAWFPLLKFSRQITSPRFRKLLRKITVIKD